MANCGPPLIILASTLMGVSGCIVGLRFWARIKLVRRVKIDDYLMLMALACELIHTVLLSVGVRYGLGRHITTLSAEGTLMALKYIVIIEFFAVVPGMFGRLSFSVFLLMIIGPTAKLKRAILWTVITVQIIINIIVIVQIYAQCGSKIAALWDQAVAATAHCQSPMVETVLGYVQSGLNSLSDMTLTVVPGFILWGLQMPRTTKFGLGAVLMLSIFAFVASMVKAVEIQNLSHMNDFTWYMVQLQIWACVENNVVIIAASIPTLRPIMRNRRSRSEYSPSQPTGGRRTTDPYTRRKGGESSPAPDGTSEEYILQNMQFRPNDHITKTTDVHIAYEERGPEEVEGGNLEDKVPDFLRESHYEQERP